MAGPTAKQSPLSSLINDGLTGVEVFCYALRDGVCCSHHDRREIADLLAGGATPATSMSDLGLTCSKCGAGNLEVRMDMREFYAKIGRDSGWTGGMGNSPAPTDHDNEPLRVDAADVAAARAKGSYP